MIAYDGRGIHQHTPLKKRDLLDGRTDKFVCCPCYYHYFDPIMVLLAPYKVRNLTTVVEITTSNYLPSCVKCPECIIIIIK